MKRVRIGIVGAGFIAKIHMAAFRQNHQIVDVVGVCAGHRENAERFAKEHGIFRVFDNFEQLCASPEVDVVDVCTPTNLHDDVILCAVENHKHVICEKPLTGYFGEDMPEVEDVGKISKAHMYEKVKEKVALLEDKIKKANVKFMYAENWVYAPAIEKMKRMLKASDMVCFELRAECSHSGSQATYSRRWKTSGGGSLMRLGSHPIATVIHLKHYEGYVRNGKPIKPKAVLANITNLTKMEVLKDKPCYVVSSWQDVEDWSVVILEFEDGSRATVFSTDVSLGGVKNRIELYGSKGMIVANITPNNAMVAFAPNESVWGDEYISEKLETKAGYSFPSPDEFWTRGYPQEMADFAMAVLENRSVLSSFDLAKETTLVMYAAYVSAELGKQVFVE
ncbi:MAG: Oxidoreductase domain protein [Thermotoga sp. 50_1627]|nr:MAG: Oxidoreductase domain protein [Thermotoga sp. 50_64]KUK25160.1 MAG: Oxidoreductase domain protein [Thermotoga sp. 50_1627]HBT38535.1 oxidoreductase [Pseudothermotoga sp.]HCO97637.1 oxidoreductase [Pseudothermotoga sp.]